MEPDPKFPVGLGLVFYILMGLAAWGLTFIWDVDLIVWHDNGWTPTIHAMIGAGLGLLTVILSNVLERYAEWARRLSEEFSKILGELQLGEVFLLAAASSIGEEIFFRGFLQQVLTDSAFDGNVWLGVIVTSLIFGLVHIGSDVKVFWPWTVMAIVLGFAIGWTYILTGNLLAPILAHFTINFLNLATIVNRNRD